MNQKELSLNLARKIMEQEDRIRKLEGGIVAIAGAMRNGGMQSVGGNIFDDIGHFFSHTVPSAVEHNLPQIVSTVAPIAVKAAMTGLGEEKGRKGRKGKSKAGNENIAGNMSLAGNEEGGNIFQTILDLFRNMSSSIKQPSPYEYRDFRSYDGRGENVAGSMSLGGEDLAGQQLGGDAFTDFFTKTIPRGVNGAIPYITPAVKTAAPLLLPYAVKYAMGGKEKKTRARKNGQKKMNW